MTPALGYTKQPQRTVMPEMPLVNEAKDPGAGVVQDSGSSIVEMLEGFSSDLALQQCCKKLTQFS